MVSVKMVSVKMVSVKMVSVKMVSVKISSPKQTALIFVVLSIVTFLHFYPIIQPYRNNFNNLF